MGFLSSVGKTLGKAVGAVATGGASLLGGNSNPIANFGGSGTLLNLYNKLNGGNSMSAKQMWDYQFDKMTAWEKEKALNGRAWDMQSLLTAGLNPALATSAGDTLGGGSPNPAEWTNAQENNNMNSGLKLMELVQARDKMLAEIGNIQADTEQKILNNDTIQKYGNKQAKANLANTLLKAGEVRANTALKQQQALSEATNQIYTRALTQHTNAQTTSVSLDNAPKIRTEQWHNAHPTASKVLTGYKEYRPMTQDLMAAVGLAGTAKKAGDISKALSKPRVTETYNSKGKFTGATKSWYE